MYCRTSSISDCSAESASGAYVERRGEAYTGILLGNLRERDHLRNLDLDGKMIF